MRLVVWFFSEPCLFPVCKFINMEEIITYELLHQTAEISFWFYFTEFKKETFNVWVDNFVVEDVNIVGAGREWWPESHALHTWHVVGDHQRIHQVHHSRMQCRRRRI